MFSNNIFFKIISFFEDTILPRMSTGIIFSVFIIQILSYLNMIQPYTVVDHLTVFVICVLIVTYWCIVELRKMNAETREIAVRTSSYLLGLSLSGVLILFIIYFQYVVNQPYGMSYEAQTLLYWLLSVIYICASVSIYGASFNKKDELCADTNKGVFYSGIVFICIVGVGLIFRTRFLSSLSFWTDESTSVLVAQRILGGYGQTLADGTVYPRAFMYHHYLAWILEMFNQVHVYISTRLANIPFYIVNSVLVYKIGKHIANRQVALLSSFLFVFSWISISMFREARFYEMFTSFFLLFCYIILRICQYVLSQDLSLIQIMRNTYTTHTSAHVYIQTKNFFVLIMALGILTIVTFDTQKMAFFITYPLMVFGVLVYILKRDIRGIYITACSCIIILLGLITAYGNEFKLSYFIKYPQPYWKMLAQDKPFVQFWNFLLDNQYAYIGVLSILVIPLLLYIHKKNIGVQYVVSVVFGWYVIIAIQGYGSDAIRYFYPVWPLVTILLGLVLYQSIVFFQGFARHMMVLMTIFAMLATLYGGAVESRSSLTNESRNVVKNSNYGVMIQFLSERNDFNDAVIITDNTISMSYYIHFGKAPDYIALNSDILPYSSEKKDAYTYAPEIDYRDILKLREELRKPIYVMFLYQPTRMGAEYMKYFDSIAEKIYDYRSSRVIYYLK